MVVLAALCGWTVVPAQSTSSAIHGVVSSDAGSPVAGVVVQARSDATGVVRSAITSENGFYRIDLLTPGVWTVAVRLADGSVTQSRTVRLGLQESQELDFRTGQMITERVRVVAEKPLVDKFQTGSELRVDGQRADRLPLPGRLVTDLALLDSGVASAPPGNFYGERGAVFTVNGQSGRSNSFLVDGLDNNDQLSGTSMNSFFSQQVVQEFVVMTHQFSPEFGRASGGVLNIITRRGDNELRSEAFLQGTASGWNSSGSFVDSLPGDGQRAVRRFQGGFWLGGPFHKDKSFYFLAYENLHADEVVPYTGIDRNGVAGGLLAAPARGDNLFFRTDFALGRSQFLMARLSVDDRDSDGVNVGGIRTPESGFRIEERDVQLAASLTSVISPKVFNELRLLAGRSSFEQLARSAVSAVTRPSGIFGGNELNRQERVEDRIQLVENLTWIHGSHTLKFGLDVTRSSTDLDALFNPQGNFLYQTDNAFEPGDCGNLSTNAVFDPTTQTLRQGPINCPGVVGVDDDGDGIIDEPGFINTYPVVYTLVEGQPSATFDDTRWSLFVQDSWQATERLLLDYGLRYDLSTFELPSDAAVDSTIPNGGAEKDTDNVAPRLGFTFAPGSDGRFVIRGGAGIFYDKLVLAFPAVAAVTSQTAIGFFFPQGLAIELTEEVIEQIGMDRVRQLVSFPEELTLRFSTAPQLDTPYTVQYNLGFEKQLGQRHSLRTNVVRALGYHLPLFRDLNPPVSVFPACPDPVFRNCLGIPLHRDPAHGSIVAITTEGRSWYTALDVNWRWRGDDGWVSAAYTWSKSLDLGFDPLKNGVSLPADSDNLAADKGRADGDRRHRFVLSGEAGLPWGGLRGSTVLQVATGVPFNVVTGLDDNLDGFVFERPPGVGRNTGEDTSMSAVNQVRLAEGLAPLDRRLKEPNFFQVDLRIWKPFAYRGGQREGQVFFQVFNLLNRTNGTLVEGRAVSQNFGEVVGLAGPPLTFELGLKLGF